MKYCHKNGGTSYCAVLALYLAAVCALPLWCFIELLDVSYSAMLPSQSFVLRHRTASVLPCHLLWGPGHGLIAQVSVLTLEVHD